MRKLMVVLAVLAGCQGEVGPMGPQGPQGNQGSPGLPGPAGPAGQTLVRYTVPITNGAAVQQLPAAAGTITRAPLLSCYLGSGTTWLAVSDGWASGATPYCGLVWDGTWWAVMSRAYAGYSAVFVVAY